MALTSIGLILTLAAGPSDADVAAQANALAEEAWARHIAPGIPSASDPQQFTSWSSRLTPPLPAEWPKFTRVDFYAYARGIKLGAIGHVEYEGPVWARASFELPFTQKGSLSVLTTSIAEAGTIGVRPLTSEEITILQSRPLEMLLSAKSDQRDDAVRSYYCLQHKLGNIPAEIERYHRAFFEWLNCRALTRPL